MLYLDTSVLVAYYLPEALSGKIQKLLTRQSGAAISPLVETELLSALSRKVRTGELSESDARRVAALFDVHICDAVFEMVHIHPREYRLARDWLATFSTPLRPLDALHLAAAFSNDLELVTADEAMASAGKAFGVRVQLL